MIYSTDDRSADRFAIIHEGLLACKFALEDRRQIGLNGF
jgi:hypothetical protein